MLGIPLEGDFGLIIAGGEKRPGDIESQMASTMPMINIDPCHDGVINHGSDQRGDGQHAHQRGSCSELCG